MNRPFSSPTPDLLMRGHAIARGGTLVLALHGGFFGGFSAPASAQSPEPEPATAVAQAIADDESRPTLAPTPRPRRDPHRASPRARRGKAALPSALTENPPSDPSTETSHPAHTPSTPAAPLIRLTRGHRPVPDARLERAYEAMLAGRLSDAGRDYDAILRTDPHQLDALLGLATIADQSGHAHRARMLYLRALEVDPTDPTAQAGLIAAGGLAHTSHSETRLKAALAAHPESAAARFALGNLYAVQQRWAEARQAYFAAYASDDAHPDFIFNLAVSLDHLHLTPLAIVYYRKALDATEAAERPRGFSFDPDRIRQRLAELHS